MRRLKMMAEDVPMAGGDVTWSDEAGREYEVYVKGQLDMGPFANLMERVEYIGREIVYRYYRL